jgi:hypothetical protein
MKCRGAGEPRPDGIKQNLRQFRDLRFARHSLVPHSADHRVVGWECLSVEWPGERGGKGYGSGESFHEEAPLLKKFR